MLKAKMLAKLIILPNLLKGIFSPMEDKKEFVFTFKDELEQELFYQIIQVSLSKERGEILKK